MPKPYMPSNGTEGEIFHEQFCYQCKLYGDPDEGDVPPCVIQGNALAGIQPEEWIEEDDGSGPRCTAYQFDDGIPLENLPLDPNAVIRPLL